MFEFDPSERVTAADALNADYFSGEENVDGRNTRLDIERVGSL